MFVVRSLATSRSHQMHSGSCTIIVVSQLMTTMWMALASHTDIRNPRKHIWTFAAALHEVYTPHPYSLCPCTNIHNRLSIPIPPYVGSDYFCDTGSESTFQLRFYPYDPPWDGRGCGRLNTCCSFNNPPWFMKELPSLTKDDIEMRLCADQPRTDEDITFEAIELYVQ